MFADAVFARRERSGRADAIVLSATVMNRLGKHDA